jgi:hypothetical protein
VVVEHRQRGVEVADPRKAGPARDHLQLLRFSPAFDDPSIFDPKDVDAR